ncbi:MAG: hypothetical protein LBI04_06425 [Treponema sp.]|jgi:formamidopyrimidine-DNA glycosylase|nr:hypothetical protein [Treponema sp.]
MPELPDLHVFSINLKKRLLSKRIESVTIVDPLKIDTPNLFRERLTGTHIQDIVREGKELRFVTENKNSFNVHLMMHGNFSIIDRNGVDKNPVKMISLCFEDAQNLVIADKDKRCKVTLNAKFSDVPDALADTFTLEYFKGVLKKNARKNIKAVLVDQHVVRGIGNAYVDEILWKADISPESVTGKIPEEKVKDLHEAIPFIFNDAIQNILKISPDIISGEIRSFLKVHNYSKKFTDEGDKIIKKTVAGKDTFFTDKQKKYI